MSRVTHTVIVILLTLSSTISSSVTTNNAESKAKTKDVVIQKEMSPSDDQDNISVLENAMSECNETFRTEISYLISLNESGSFPDESDRTPKCFVRCVLETTKVASEAGQYDPVRTAAVFPKERGEKTMDDLEDMARGCTDRKETCKCERAYQYIKCLMETQIKRYLETS